MEFHLLKLNQFCRFCKSVLDESEKSRRKQSVCDVLKLKYPVELADLEFDNEDSHQFPLYMCKLCYNKCGNWKISYDKHKLKERRKSVETRREFETNVSIYCKN